MKIIVKNKKDLLDSLNKVHSVVEKKNTLQILSNIFLSVQGDQLTIKATDLEVSIETTLPVQVIQPGRATISAKSFLDIVRELPEKEIHIHSKDNHWVGISCGKSTFNIMGLSPEDFPSLPSYSGKSSQKAKVESLQKMIDHTLYAVSVDETRYHMNGVYLEAIDGKKYIMVATDGHRLAYFEDVPFEGPGLPLTKGVIIPRKGIQEIRKVIEGAGPTVDLHLEGNHILVKTPNTFLSVRLIEGQFPDYKQVIPKNSTRSVELDRNAFFDSLSRVSLLANEKSRGVKLYLSTGKVEISSSNPDMGEATEILETPYKGEPLEIGFNAKYLQDTLAVTQSPSIVFELNDRMSPGVIRIPESSQYLSVLMPMRL
jgi:DNA polymerase III subunit beta